MGQGSRNVHVREDVPLFPLHTVLFPGMLLPLRVFEPRHLALMDRVVQSQEEFGIALIAKGGEVGGPATPHEVGTLARVVRVERRRDNTMNVVVEGTRRFRIRALNRRQPYLQADVEEIEGQGEGTVRAYALSLSVRDLWEVYTGLMREVTGITVAPDKTPREARALAFFVAAGLQVSPHDKQALLSQPDIAEILAQEVRLLRRELRLLRFIADTQEMANEARMGPTGFLSRN